MQALWTGMQALLATAGVLALALLGEASNAWMGTGVGLSALLAALACNAIYTHALDERPRSESRAAGDHRRAVAMLIAFPLPTAYAAAATQIGPLRPAEQVLGEHSIATFVACLVSVALMLLYVSSTVDWYVVKAWRDGIVIDPPCRRRGNRPSWLLITRVWLLHRIVAAIGFFVGLWTLVGLAWFELLRHPGNSDWVLYLLGLASPSAIPLFFMRRYIAELGHAIGLAFGNLKVSLGDGVAWRSDGETVDGIAYDVSIDGGYRVIKADGTSTTLSLSQVVTGTISVDERDPGPEACTAVRRSGLDGATDFWEPRLTPSARWLTFR
jgi:hypothetical protein